VREEGGVLIIPVLEEVVVVQKRLVLKEELHIHRNRRSERVDEAVKLKSMRAEAERVAAENQAGDRARTRIRRKERLE